MKLNYYSYYINNTRTGEKFGQEIDHFLRTFCKYDNSVLKNQIKMNGKNLYLLNPVGNLFLLLQTSNTDLIKKINKIEISASDLDDILSNDESIAFVSYIYFYKLCFGIASSGISAARTPTFCHFVNQLLIKTNNDNYQFVTIPNLIKETTREEALDLEFMGKCTIEVGRDNTFFEHVGHFFGAEIIDKSDISSMEIIIKPKRKGNIKQAISNTLKKINDEDLQKFIINARSTAAESLTEYYIEGKGIIHDKISSADYDKLASNIRTKIENNVELRERLNKQKNEITTQKIDSIYSFNSLDAWSDCFDFLQNNIN
nr:hypothetical protein [Snodgrassella alvi]